MTNRTTNQLLSDFKQKKFKTMEEVMEEVFSVEAKMVLNHNEEVADRIQDCEFCDKLNEKLQANNLKLEELIIAKAEEIEQG